jgi:hypothetical protein
MLTRDSRYVAMSGSGSTAPVSLFRHGEGGSFEPVEGFEFGPSFYAGTPPEYGDPWVVFATEATAPLGHRIFLYRLDRPGTPELVAEWTSVGGAVAGDIDPRWRWFVQGDVPSIRVHDIPSGELSAELDPAPGASELGGPSGVRFDPSGDRLLVSSPNGSSQLYDTATWTLVDEEVIGRYDIALGYWSDDGNLVATSDANGQVTIRDGHTFEPIREMVGAISLGNTWAEGALIFSKDNSLLLTNHDDRPRLWDVATGQQVGVEFPTDERTNSGVNFGDTLQLVTGAPDSALVWNLDVAEWAEIACRVAGSNLRRSEWDQWGPRDEGYRSICDQYPIEA